MCRRITIAAVAAAATLALAACGTSNTETDPDADQWTTGEDARTTIESSGHECTMWNHLTDLHGPDGDYDSEAWECTIDDEYYIRIQEIEDLAGYKDDRRADDGTYPGVIFRNGWGIDCFGDELCADLADDIGAKYWG